MCVRLLLRLLLLARKKNVRGITKTTVSISSWRSMVFEYDGWERSDCMCQIKTKYFESDGRKYYLFVLLWDKRKSASSPAYKPGIPGCSQCKQPPCQTCNSPKFLTSIVSPINGTDPPSSALSSSRWEYNSVLGRQDMPSDPFINLLP